VTGVATGGGPTGADATSPDRFSPEHEASSVAAASPATIIGRRLSVMVRMAWASRRNCPVD
jgi:hypothetical protein